MGTNEQKHEVGAIRLETREAAVAGMRTEYRLELQNGYWITAVRAGETARVFLGDALQAAWAVFETVSEHRVLPCTLEDVCADLLYLRETGGV